MSKRTGTIHRAMRGTGLPHAVVSAIDRHWAERQRQREQGQSAR